MSELLFVGELSLDGKVRSVPGIINYVETAKECGFRGVCIPAQAKDEARLINGVEIYPVKSLEQAYQHLVDEAPVKAIPPLKSLPKATRKSSIDYQDVYGQTQAKCALEVAATGGYNILFNGPPGADKTMLARSLLSILPPPSRDEVVSITKLHSLSGSRVEGIVADRPFRSPHHTTSDIAIIGGGQDPTPGEISLAHNGVLFLDELPEFCRGVLEVLRQPLEDGHVAVSRTKRTVTYPAQFMLVAAQNPCPCGFINDETRECVCSPAQVDRYKKKLSGTLLDRIDMQIMVQRVEHDRLLKPPKSESSQEVAKRVRMARKISTERNRGHSNARLDNKAIKKFCQTTPEAASLLENALRKLDMSACGYMRILKVARSIADLDRSELIDASHLGEALQYREFSRFN